MKWRRSLDAFRRDRASVGEFLSSARTIVESNPSPVRVGMMLTICALLVAALLAGIFCRVDIYATARGRIQPQGRSKVVQPVAEGKVARVNVQNGDRVRAGQVLVELEAVDAAAVWRQKSDLKTGLEAQVARLREAVAAARAGTWAGAHPLPFPLDVDGQTRQREQAVLDADLAELHATLELLDAKLQQQIQHERTLSADVAAQQALVHTSGQRVTMHEELAKRGYDSQVQLVNAQEDLNTQAASLANARGGQAEARAEIKVTQAQRAETISKFILANSQQLDDSEKKLQQAAQDLVKAQYQLEHTTLVAPIDGTVQEVTVTTIGQVVSAGQQLMTIVPTGSRLEIEAQVLNKDVGFVQAGQAVVVEVDSFPFTRYGTVAGRVLHVSRDAVTSAEVASTESTQNRSVSPEASAAAPLPKMDELVYPVTIALDRSDIVVDGVPRPLTPGMSVVAEIRTGDRRLLEYLLSPVLESIENAGHER